MTSPLKLYMCVQQLQDMMIVWRRKSAIQSPHTKTSLYRQVLELSLLHTNIITTAAVGVSSTFMNQSRINTFKMCETFFFLLSFCVEAALSLPLTAESLQTLHISAQHQALPSLSGAPPNSRNRAMRTGKENICLQGGGGGGGGDPYESFARTDRSKRDKRRPEWNTQR